MAVIPPKLLDFVEFADFVDKIFIGSIRVSGGWALEVVKGPGTSKLVRHG
jgi:hypothetical protein